MDALSKKLLRQQFLLITNLLPWTSSVFYYILAEQVAPALDKGKSGPEVFDDLLRIVASHFDVTGPSGNFEKPYGFGVADVVSLFTCFREYGLLVSSISVSGQQTGPTVTMIV